LRVLNPLHLRTLSVVLRAGSFAAAGRQLGCTGSAVSQQMSALEADSGLTLFERGAHGIRPTAAAQLLSERAGETLGALASLEEAVREIATGTQGRLGLGCFPTASEVLVPSALASPEVPQRRGPLRRRRTGSAASKARGGRPGHHCGLSLRPGAEDLAGRSAADRARCGGGQALGSRALSALGSAARAPTTSANDKGMF
jgi:hypothetical protein